MDVLVYKMAGSLTANEHFAPNWFVCRSYVVFIATTLKDCEPSVYVVHFAPLNLPQTSRTPHRPSLKAAVMEIDDIGKEMKQIQAVDTVFLSAETYENSTVSRDRIDLARYGKKQQLKVSWSLPRKACLPVPFAEIYMQSVPLVYGPLSD